MSGKGRRSKSDNDVNYWDTVKGWKQVEVGDEFLVGSDEYGFMGLEELDPKSIGKFADRHT